MFITFGFLEQSPTHSLLNNLTSLFAQAYFPALVISAQYFENVKIYINAKNFLFHNVEVGFTSVQTLFEERNIYFEKQIILAHEY